MADAKRRTRRRGIIAGAAVGVAVCLAGGGIAWANLRPQPVSYRLATAVKADVAQTADLAGTVASASRADRAFQVAGTVSAVKVKVGDTVTAGQTIATLDTAALQDAVTQAQQAVTSAQQTLDDDLASQTSSASTVTTTASASPSTLAAVPLAVFAAAPAAQPAKDPVKAALAAVTAAQNTLISNGNAVTSAQQKLTSDLAAIQTTAPAAGAQATACSTFLQATVSTTDPAQAATDIANARGALAGCQTAVTAVLADEQAVADAESQVTADVTALDNAVTTLSTAVTAAQSAQPTAKPGPSPSAQPSRAAQGAGTAGGSGGTGTGTGTGGISSGSGTRGASGSGPTGPSTGSKSGSGDASAASAGSSGAGGTRTSTAASAEQVVADQADVASAQAALAVAQQNVQLATLTTPIGGTVAAVSIAAGSSVSAKSTSSVISVIGSDGFVVDTSVAVTSVGPLKVGEKADVTVSGVSGRQSGTITSIGFLNTASGSSTPSYDVTVALDGDGSGLLNGASARLTVDVAKASGVLTVPSSALHLGAGNSYSVAVVTNGAAQTRRVTVGAIGSDRVEITGGLTAGARVVLADLSSTVSSDSTSTSNTRFGGTARLGGTGFGGGAGFTGGTAGTGGLGGALRIEPKG